MNNGDAVAKKRIVVLDDEPSILEVLGELLQDVGYDCTLTTSALKALEILQGGGYSLLITDLKMPEMQGIEVLQRAKAHDPDLAVIVVTALLEVTSAVEALRSGADDYLLKPFNLSEISLSVEKALERRKLVIDNRRYQEELESRVQEATQELQTANSELRTTKEYLESLIDSSVDAILTFDETGRVSLANAGAVQMFGYSRDAFLQMTIDKLFAGGNEEYRHIQRMLRDDKPLQNYETELARKGGEQIHINMSISVVRDAERKEASQLAICKDITQQKRLEFELKEMSIKDSLTGLYNQRYFYDRLETEIERAKRQNRPLSLLLFDVDQFKTYNDCHGHLEGDNVLSTVGQIVIECTREHVDIGFRYGGDEFTVILPEADETQALIIAERIRTSFEAKRFDNLTLSIGLMSYKQGSSLRSFIRFTDAMMYDAKQSGGNRVYVYNHGASNTAADAQPEDEPLAGS
jgi:diguanylate cyclase (GGDEF)-like protein/PAS domain S-box-containing protein